MFPLKRNKQGLPWKSSGYDSASTAVGANLILGWGAETPILWPSHAKSWLIGKDSDAGRDWGREEKGTTEDEMAGWHHWLNGHGFGWTLGVGDGQGGLACCNSWGHKESDTTERLNWTGELNPTSCKVWPKKREGRERNNSLLSLHWKAIWIRVMTVERTGWI